MKRTPALLLAFVLMLPACSGESGLEIGQERVSPDEPALEAKMIELIREVSLSRRDERGDGVVRRFNQPKTIGCLDATFVVEPLPADLAFGLFATPARYPAKLRFANATRFDDREADLRGLSIKVAGVPGATSVDGGAGVQDFTLNSYPALFAGTPKDFTSFVEATAKGRVWAYFLNPFDPHLGSLAIVLRARGNPPSPFAVSYFSTTPYRYGLASNSAVKYSVGPAAPARGSLEPDHEDYLRDAIRSELEEGEASLDFLVQFQTDPDLMPIEDASVVWPEEISPYRKVARIVIEPQAFDRDDRMAACEAMQFNPWNGLEAHRPLGGINRVRRNLYRALGEFRSQQNARSG